MSGSSSSSSSNNSSGYTNTGTSASQATVPTWRATYQPSALTGYSATAANQTGGIESKPSWMSGVWDADWWGRNASTGQAMSNADLTPKNNNSLLNAIYNPQTTQATQGSGETDWDKWREMLKQSEEDTLKKSRNQSLFGKQDANWADYFAQ